ncbi:putative xyloglucan fucosyltransferase [Arabidopsis thaliana]
MHLPHDSRDSDKMFSDQKDQNLIGSVPWLIVDSNVYFVPSLWFNPTFQTELTKLFPQKETVFHHLARYLSYQTRDSNSSFFAIKVDTTNASWTISSCTQRQETPVNISNIPKCKAVLVTSLTGEIIKAQGRHLDMFLIVFED